jgi:hypothetical protein
MLCGGDVRWQVGVESSTSSAGYITEGSITSISTADCGGGRAVVRRVIHLELFTRPR